MYFFIVKIVYYGYKSILKVKKKIGYGGNKK